MPLFQLLLVAIIQGVTEFLPVSSSAHLILLPKLSGLQDQGLAIDVAVHVGTLGAVILYFWRDVRMALGGVPQLIRGRTDTPGARLALCLALATIPVVVAGLMLKVTGLDEAMRSIAVIGWTMILFGVVLWWADTRSPATRQVQHWSYRHAIAMGLWQAVALIPGTSRSGICITGARFMGYTRADAARIAMLMSIPTIMASGLLLGIDVAASADAQLARDGAIAAVFALGAALVALWGMMKLLKFVSFTPYVIYRIIVGSLLLWIAYT